MFLVFWLSIGGIVSHGYFHLRMEIIIKQIIIIFFYYIRVWPSRSSVPHEAQNTSLFKDVIQYNFFLYYLVRKKVRTLVLLLVIC